MTNPFLTQGYVGPEYFCDRENDFMANIFSSPKRPFYQSVQIMGLEPLPEQTLSALEKANVVAKSPEGYYIYDRYLSLWLI